MGTTIRELVYDVEAELRMTRCSRQYRSADLWGMSPGIITDLPIDFDSLQEAGAMMGSGGWWSWMKMIVWWRLPAFSSILPKKSCGKCTFCRLGTKRDAGYLN